MTIAHCIISHFRTVLRFGIMWYVWINLTDVTSCSANITHTTRHCEAARTDGSLQIIFKVLNDKNLPRTTQTFLFRFILLFMCTFNIIFNITVLIMFSFFSYFCLRIFIRWKISTAFRWSVIVFLTPLSSNYWM